MVEKSAAPGGVIHTLETGMLAGVNNMDGEGCRIRYPVGLTKPIPAPSTNRAPCRE